ncbi:type IV secretion system protein [Azospira sp. I09]|jgi:conjugal transfer/entry exclusion protein|uniref:type IV secretion system protein n=1 Tax=Azospira sp. I09 TaxID=1765049 RepID=UPI001261120B|nr:type IV secretion system protein [Azospira sp. I09]BBN90338.1 hypothetical protein AZSP09_33610 [Azospira sp. I09]
MGDSRLSVWMLCLALLAKSATAGMVVTDPTSYSYYVEQIKQQVEMLEKASKQVETMGGVLSEAQRIQSNLTGHYNRAVSLVNRINRLSNTISRESSGGIVGEAKKWGNVGRQVGGVLKGGADEGDRVIKDVSQINGNDIYQDTKEILDEVFVDPRDIANREDRYRSISRRYQVQQGALKEVVAKSERTLAGIKDRITIVQELAGMVDQTANQKDAQDLGNRILVEVLATLVDMLAIAAQANQAEALANYRGASDVAMEQRKKRLEQINSSALELDKIFGQKSGRRPF